MVEGGWAIMNSFRYCHWLAAVLSSESSIRIARKSLSPFFQSAICLRSFPKDNCTSSFDIGGGASFFDTAVTVNEAFPEEPLDCAWAHPPHISRSVTRNTPTLANLFW